MPVGFLLAVCSVLSEVLSLNLMCEFYYSEFCCCHVIEAQVFVLFIFLLRFLKSNGIDWMNMVSDGSKWGA